VGVAAVNASRKDFNTEVTENTEKNRRRRGFQEEWWMW
jgi:hypothetical protein